MSREDWKYSKQGRDTAARRPRPQPHDRSTGSMCSQRWNNFPLSHRMGEGGGEGRVQALPIIFETGQLLLIPVKRKYKSSTEAAPKKRREFNNTAQSGGLSPTPDPLSRRSRTKTDRPFVSQLSTHPLAKRFTAPEWKYLISNPTFSGLLALSEQRDVASLVELGQILLKRQGK